MLSEQTLLAIGRERREEELELEEEALAQTLDDLAKLAEVQESTEVPRVALLLGDVGVPWSPPPGLHKLMEFRLRYQGQPRLLVVVRLAEPLLRPGQSPASQLHRIAEVVNESMLAFAAEGEAAEALAWPLRDPKSAQALGAKVLWARGTGFCLGLLSCPLPFRRLLCCCGSGPDVSNSRVIATAARHFGGAAAFPFAWIHYTEGALWTFLAVLLPLAGALCGLLRDGRTAVELEDATLGSAEHVLWETIKMASVVWMLLVAKEWSLPDLSGGMAARDRQPVEGWTPQCHPAVHVASTAVLGLLVLLAQLVVAQGMFAFIFWLELWLTFEWGDCINLGCHDPQEKWGFLGLLAGLVPGIVEILLFLLFTEVSSLLVEQLLRVRNYRILEDRQFFRLVAAMTMEAVGKIGTFGVLAMVFVPEWEDESALPGLPLGFSNMTLAEQRQARSGVDCSDLPDAAIFGRGAVLCLRRRLAVDDRRWLFQRAMKGPFVVAPFLAILMNVVLPLVAQKLSRCCFRCERREERSGQDAGCGCGVLRFIVRAVGLFFAHDCEHVGSWRFLLHGNPFELQAVDNSKEPMSERQDGVVPNEDSAAIAIEASGGQARAAPVPQLVRYAVHQALAKEFSPESIVLANLLTVQWIGFFSCIWPWGCLPTLLAWILQARSFWALLLLNRRKPFPEPAYVLHAATRRFMFVMAHLAVLWHVSLSVITYNARLFSVTLGDILRLVACLALAAVLAMWFAAWAVHALLSSPCLSPRDSSPQSARSG